MKVVSTSVISLLSLFLISGCAFFDDLNKIEKTVQELCNYDGAFNEGVRDAKSGYPINTQRIKNYCANTAKEPGISGISRWIFKRQKVDSLSLRYRPFSSDTSSVAKISRK